VHHLPCLLADLYERAGDVPADYRRIRAATPAKPTSPGLRNLG
jgi:hypothetical protein